MGIGLAYILIGKIFNQKMLEIYASVRVIPKAYLTIRRSKKNNRRIIVPPRSSASNTISKWNFSVIFINIYRTQTISNC